MPETKETLRKLTADLESDRVERKPSLSQSKEIRQTLCAFANDLPGSGKPGVLFVGLQDDGTCADLEIDDELLQKLANIRGEGTILPMPVMTVRRLDVGRCHVAVVQVEPVTAPPARYNGRAFVRVGPTTRPVTVEEERRLSERRRSRDLPFDVQPVSSATLEDLDLDLFQDEYLPSALSPEVRAENRRSREQQLASLRFATTDTPPRATVLGLLVTGKDPRDFLPGAYVQFLRLAGTSLADPIQDTREISGPLSTLLQELDTVLERQISTAADITSSPREIRRPDYPIEALRQLVRNAILHRNYEGTAAPVRVTWFEDRIEIQNPGGPYGQVTKDNFGQPGITDYRNYHVAEAMKNLGYVQRFGVGIPIARRELEKNGNPELEFVVEDTHVLAIVRKRTA